MQSNISHEPLVHTERMSATFTKYHLGNNKVLHHFTAATDEHFHDHPFAFKSTILAGGYREEVATILPNGTLQLTTVMRMPGTTHTVGADTIHKITFLADYDCWTIIEPDNKVKEPGFYKADEQGVWHRYWHESDWRLIVQRRRYSK